MNWGFGMVPQGSRHPYYGGLHGLGKVFPGLWTCPRGQAPTLENKTLACPGGMAPQKWAAGMGPTECYEKDVEGEAYKWCAPLREVAAEAAEPGEATVPVAVAAASGEAAEVPVPKRKIPWMWLGAAAAAAYYFMGR